MMGSREQVVSSRCIGYSYIRIFVIRVLVIRVLVIGNLCAVRTLLVMRHAACVSRITAHVLRKSGGLR